MKLYILAFAILVGGCTIAPKSLNVGTATISESGKQDSGIVANFNGGYLVEPSYHDDYTNLLKIYGSRLSPANPDPATGWDLKPVYPGTVAGPGLLWCNGLVAQNCGFMRHWRENP